jgi:hypothetical protein
MNYKLLKTWFIITFTLAVIAIVIRGIWQIVVIPTAGTMLIFIPLIIALLGMNAFFAYMITKPQRMKSRWFAVGSTIALSAGLLAGVTHFVRFIISDEADPPLSKVISALVLASSVSIYFIIIYAVWSYRRSRKNGRPKV